LQNCNPDGAVIVTTPQDLSVDMIKREINFCQKMKLPIIGVVENM
jgi:Mrp family chromosome partitioning ATPase